MANDRFVRRAAVLGAGVMGAQIAAHLTSAGVETLLFELPADGADKNAHVKKAIAAMGKITKPAPVMTKTVLSSIIPANYDTDLEALKSCDLIIEAVAEREDIKARLYDRIASHVCEQAIFATNTSGIGIDVLAKNLPRGLRQQFCGVHFFNPPRHMALVELIAGSDTDSAIVDKLESFFTTVLGKSVVRAKDRPNFVGNRLGVFNIQMIMYHAERFGLAFDTVDALTGKAIGRAPSATFKTCDIVGLDTLVNVLSKTAEVLTDDPWHQYYGVPGWMQKLVDQGRLGSKTKGGIYQRGADKKAQVLNPESGDYRPVDKSIDPGVEKILKNPDWKDRLDALRECDHPQAQFLWSIHRDGFHYAAAVLEEIADNARDADFAVRWGFGWKQGPFEMWQATGWRQVADWIEQDIRDEKTMTSAALPAWVKDIDAVHKPQGSWAPADALYRPRSDLPVYRRQVFPEPILGEKAPDRGETLFETDAVRCWHGGDDVAVLTFKTKMNSISDAVLEGINKALDLAEAKFAGLVIWQGKVPFSVGADLEGMAPLVMQGDYEGIARVVKRFQETTNRLRYSHVPTVAALQGYAFGGGCEVTMHCDRAVAALETYIGLVEIGVGLLPAGGGCKEWAMRVDRDTPDNNMTTQLTRAFTNVAQAKVATSAIDARELGILNHDDIVVFNPRELLYVARSQVRAMAEAGYRPPLKRSVRVAGSTGVAVAEMAMLNFLEGHFMSDHDFFIGQKIASAICGGDVEPNSKVSEEWLLKLERDAFVELVAHPKSQERAIHMLQTGKPLRN